MNTDAFIPVKAMNFSNADADRQRLFAYCNSLKASTLTIDLSTVNECDSAGLAFLIEAKRMARQFKKNCQIIGMNKTILALAEFCGVEKVLMTEENV